MEIIRFWLKKDKKTVKNDYNGVFDKGIAPEECSDKIPRSLPLNNARSLPKANSKLKMRSILSNDPGPNRTADLPLRRRPLYPLSYRTSGILKKTNGFF